MLSIVIPCYNESENLPELFEKIRPLYDIMTDFEIILVNNGSTDNSATLLKKLSRSIPIKIIHLDQNQGYGFGILSGLDVASGEVLAWTHADLQTDPADVFKAYELYQKLKPQYPNLLIKGKRKNRKLLEVLLTLGMQLYVNCKLKCHLSDINAQPKLFSKEFYYQIRPQAPYDFSLDLYILYQMSWIGTIKTIDVFFHKRTGGEAKGGGNWKGRIKLIKRTLQYVNKLKKNLRKSK
ncbi:Glycosyl transferase family 2 [Brevinema andersonii]|uniref:Glycosyl transferase family 2 n=1 Tax=Brevinema andersonii TaxID=34097 RepID=A0A1I1D1S9_BREAD|nr:glycosyltransferase family 2 protein [Brevinema andersonii]SFB68949.1 Glycosyl transferase family 2 [Brevinema andersonii]